MHLQKEKASEVTKDKHLGIHTVYYRVIDLILPTFVALVFGDFSTEVGEGKTFFTLCALKIWAGNCA